jgi:hypothetical protein
MRIERAVFYNGRYEGVYLLVREKGLEWEYVRGTHTSGDGERNQRIIDLYIRLDLPPERFQKGWLREAKYYSIVTNIDFKPEDLE